MLFRIILLALLLSGSLLCEGQSPPAAPAPRSFLEPTDSLHPGRFWISAGAGAAIYSGFSVGLWQVWYRDYELGPFHLFNDWHEWEQMDKMGHFFTAYHESNWIFTGARWTGMRRRSAMWTGIGAGLLLQSTVEVMDGFSEKWGFSMADMGFNLLGASLFAAQELCWEEQRIRPKISSSPAPYPSDPVFSTDGSEQTTLQARADELFGTSFGENFVKDYNAQTIWLSANIHAFLPRRENTRFPRWLNLALGYGAANMYGGFDNSWTTGQAEFFADPDLYPRYRQFYLSPDIDLSRLPVRSRLLRTLLGTLNFIKIPAPALEFNTRGKLRLHALYW